MAEYEVQYVLCTRPETAPVLSLIFIDSFGPWMGHLTPFRIYDAHQSCQSSPEQSSVPDDAQGISCWDRVCHFGLGALLNFAKMAPLAQARRAEEARVGASIDGSNTTHSRGCRSIDR